MPHGYAHLSYPVLLVRVAVAGSRAFFHSALAVRARSSAARITVHMAAATAAPRGSLPPSVAASLRWRRVTGTGRTSAGVRWMRREGADVTVRAHVGDATEDPATPSTRASSTPPGLPRRAAVAALSAAALFASSSPPASASPAGSLTQRGMAKFIAGDVEGSVEDFDLVISAEPRQAPYLWRGPGRGAWGGAPPLVTSACLFPHSVPLRCTRTHSPHARVHRTLLANAQALRQAPGACRGSAVIAREGKEWPGQGGRCGEGECGRVKY